MKIKCAHSKRVVRLIGGGNWCGSCGALLVQWGASSKLTWKQPDNGAPEMARALMEIAKGDCLNESAWGRCFSQEMVENPPHDWPGVCARCKAREVLARIKKNAS